MAGLSAYAQEEVVLLREHYNPLDVRTWPFYPIVMPLRDGMGPATDAECDKITWEVWDRFCGTHGSYDYLPDAINEALRLNKELLG